MIEMNLAERARYTSRYVTIVVKMYTLYYLSVLISMVTSLPSVHFAQARPTMLLTSA